MSQHWRRALVALAIAPVLIGMSSCTRATRTPDLGHDEGPAASVRLGYFPNVTHASALIGLRNGTFAKELGRTTLVPTMFNAGPEEVSALLGGSVDMGFMGSGPAINGFAKGGPESVRVISGATSGGAQFVVKPEINSPADLAGRTVDTPEQGNTQDVALKKWLAARQLSGSVKVQNLSNGLALNEFRKGTIAGAWLPEPWASQLVLNGGGKVLQDEKSLWPNGSFPTTVLVVRTAFLQQHPETVRAVLRGLLAANDSAAADRAGAENAVNAELKSLTQTALPPAVLDRSFDGIQLTTDPVASAFPQLAKDSVDAGVLRSAPNLTGFIDPGPLDAVLAERGRPAIDAAGLAGR